MEQIRLFVGVDPRETVAFHVFVQSVLDRTDPNRVSIHPVIGEQRDGSNRFIYARFLIPHMCGYRGRAIWADGDMVCRADIRELWDMYEPGFDVMVVKHNYSTKHPTKYLGQRNEDYERKNWSSVMLMDCANYPMRKLTPEYVAKSTGRHLHRFEFLKDDRIGDLPKEWNWLVGEYGPNPEAKLVHFTIGTPCWPAYKTWDYADEWRAELKKVNHYEPWEESYDDTPLVSER
jgi:lipopolysaccharide biosynthesis glycosyltransferase